MSALARWCYQHRLLVIAVWIGVLVGLAGISQAVKTTYDNSFTLPGTGSGSAQGLLQRSVPAQAGDSDTIVWHVTHGTVRDPAVEARMSAVLARVSRLPEVAAVAGPYAADGAGQVSRDGRTAYATVNFTRAAGNLDKADVNRVIDTAEAARAPGLAVELGGQAIENVEQAPLSSASAIGIAAAAVILFIAFGSVLAMALPIVTAVAGVGSGLMLIAPLSHGISMVDFGPILGALIGLGVGVDYALFIVTRHRRGLLSGMDPRESAVQALNTSGRAVLFAGGTVCIALLGLITLGMGFLDGLAIAAAITVVCTVLAAVTLLPALLGVFGMRVLSRRQRRRLRAYGPEHTVTGVWARWSRTVQRSPAVLAAAAVAVILALSIPLLHVRLGASDASNDPASTTTRQAYELLADGFGPGFNGPLYVVAQTRSGADEAALERLTRALPAVPGVASVAAPAPGTAGVDVITVVPASAPESAATSGLISQLRNTGLHRRRDGHLRRLRGGDER
jgi:RND superfamily putative drug exporter